MSFVIVLEAVSPCLSYLKVWFLWRPPSLADNCTVCPHEALPLPLHGSVQMSSSHEDGSYRIREHPNDLISLSDLIKDPLSKSSHRMRYWGSVQNMNFMGEVPFRTKIGTILQMPEILAETIRGEMAPSESLPALMESFSQRPSPVLIASSYLLHTHSMSLIKIDFCSSCLSSFCTRVCVHEGRVQHGVFRAVSLSIRPMESTTSTFLGGN